MTWGIERLVDAIAEGRDTPAMRDRLMVMEGKRAELAAAIEEAAAAPVVEMHPNLPDVYRQRVARLEEALNRDEVARAEAIRALRALIDRIVLHPGARRGEVAIELVGELGAILSLAQAQETGASVVGVKVVAGTGFEPVTFRL